MSVNASLLKSEPTGGEHLYSYRLARLYRMAPEDDSAEEGRTPGRSDRTAAASEDLPYRVELWSEDKQSVEQVLAVTANGSIGFAAYYAATREYPSRYVTLRYKTGIVSRWNGPEH
jgi:hypothetical protein